MKIQEVTSNVAITEKNEKQNVKKSYSQVYLIRKGHFQKKLLPDIDGFTDETVVQCYVPVLKNTFVDDSKQMIDKNDKYK